MKKYSIRQTSLALWIISMLFVIYTGMTIAIVLRVNDILSSGQAWIGVMIALPFILLSFKISRYTATVDIELILGANGIEKKSLKQFIFQKQPHIQVKWEEMQSYIFEPGRQFDIFKVRLMDGRKFGFFHDNDNNDKDDFLKFIHDFQLRADRLMKRNT